MVLEYVLTPIVVYVLILLILGLLLKSIKKALFITSIISLILLGFVSFTIYHDIKIMSSITNEQIMVFHNNNSFITAFQVISGVENPVNEDQLSIIKEIVSNPDYKLKETQQLPTIVIINLAKMIKDLPEEINIESFTVKKQDLLKGLQDDAQKDGVVAIIYSYTFTKQPPAYIISLIKNQDIRVYPKIYSFTFIKYLPDKLIQDLVKNMNFIPQA